MAGARESLPELPEEPAAPAAPAALDQTPKGDTKLSPLARRAYYYVGAVAVFTLVLCFLFGLCVFMGFLSLDRPTNIVTLGQHLYFKRIVIAMTAVYFLFGTIWMILRERRKGQAAA